LPYSTLKEINKPLTRSRFNLALSSLKERDSDLRGVISNFGPPPLWKRLPGFPTLVQIILEQQVSLSSARAAFNRLYRTIPSLTPEAFLNLNGKSLLKIGFSRQKADYCRRLAESIHSGFFKPESLRQMDDEQAKSALIQIKGIGPWTADIYLLTALRRPDIWPSGDLALATAVQQVKQFRIRPTPQELEALSQVWKPWRAVAARIFWHHYLETKKG
jgi:DNA-3-methyladenine glycosylase II